MLARDKQFCFSFKNVQASDFFISIKPYSLVKKLDFNNFLKFIWPPSTRFDFVYFPQSPGVE